MDSLEKIAKIFCKEIGVDLELIILDKKNIKNDYVELGILLDKGDFYGTMIYVEYPDNTASYSYQGSHPHKFKGNNGVILDMIRIGDNLYERKDYNSVKFLGVGPTNIQPVGISKGWRYMQQ